MKYPAFFATFFIAKKAVTHGLSSLMAIEETADGDQDNDEGDDESPDVGDARGDDYIVGMGNQSLARELVVNHMTIDHTVASIDHLARHHIVQYGFHRYKKTIVFVLFVKSAVPCLAIAE